MIKALAFATGFLALTGLPAPAQDAAELRQSPPRSPYIQVSDALPLPEFIPGLGTLFVAPETLPAGPFLAYDREGVLSATVYMIPLGELENGTSYDKLAIGAHDVSGADIYYNAGHPGVEVPHAHVVLFHDAEARARLAE